MCILCLHFFILLHYTILYYVLRKSQWRGKVETTGDVPPPRSGHAVAAYGKYMLLFGGIDFGEEADYNDLYTLDTGERLRQG